MLAFAPGFQKARTDEDMQQLYRDNLAPDLAPFKRAGGWGLDSFTDFVKVGGLGGGGALGVRGTQQLVWAGDGGVGVRGTQQLVWAGGGGVGVGHAAVGPGGGVGGEGHAAGGLGVVWG